MNYKLLFIISIILIFIYYLYAIKFNTNEGFSQFVGTFCKTCGDKTFNQCTNCFNCGWCTDEYGNGKCIGGSVIDGPFNNEKCAKFYHGDPFYQMKYRNEHYSCRDGPKSSNRIIGV